MFVEHVGLVYEPTRFAAGSRDHHQTVPAHYRLQLEIYNQKQQVTRTVDILLLLGS